MMNEEPNLRIRDVTNNGSLEVASQCFLQSQQANVVCIDFEVEVFRMSRLFRES